MSRNRLIPVLGLIGILAALGAAYSVTQLRPPSFHGTYLGETTPSEFTLEGADGPVRLADYRGQAVLLFFGYTSCPDVCPMTMARLREAMDLLGDRRREVQVVLVTVDPEVDSPRRLREYVERFDPAFSGLGGDRVALEEVARQFGIYAGGVANGPGGEAAGAASGDDATEPASHGDHPAPPPEAAARMISHTSHILGLDRDGALRVLWAPDLTAEEIARDVRGLLRL